MSQQIYSLPPLTAWVPLRAELRIMVRNRAFVNRFLHDLLTKRSDTKSHHHQASTPTKDPLVSAENYYRHKYNASIAIRQHLPLFLHVPLTRQNEN